MLHLTHIQVMLAHFKSSFSLTSGGALTEMEEGWPKHYIAPQTQKCIPQQHAAHHLPYILHLNGSVSAFGQQTDHQNESFKKQKILSSLCMLVRGLSSVNHEGQARSCLAIQEVLLSPQLNANRRNTCVFLFF